MVITSENKRDMSWVLPLSGLMAWPVGLIVVLLIGLFNTGPDGGWVMMAVGFLTMGAIVIVNLVSIVATGIMWYKRKKQHAPLGKPVVIGLCYFGLALIVSLIIMGPGQLVSDSVVVVIALFKMIIQGHL